MLSEQEFRLGMFEDGTPVRLADGQEWQFPRPIVRLAPANNDQGWKTVLVRSDGGVFAELMAKYEAIGDDATIASLASVELAIAKHLLTSNYGLSDEQVGSLLQFGYDEKTDPEGSEIRRAVMGVVFGYGAPKPSDVGDGSASSSTESTPTGGPSTT